MNKKRIYLAGPDVFYRNATDHFASLKALCEERGLIGVEPADGGLSQGVVAAGPVIAERIYQANIELIREADAVLANLAPFRGQVEPDSGTAFEVGFAVALGKPVAGVVPQIDCCHEDKIKHHFGSYDFKGQPFDQQYDMLIESFQQPANLMLARSSALFGSTSAALEYLFRKLQ